MKKILPVLFLLLLINSAEAQVYHNEWINYSKTYYKFKVAADGLYRINKSVLDAHGLGATPAQNFQLWRNGQEVPIFTSIPTGPLGSSDYIQFYGNKNDGSLDTKLYKEDSLQMHTGTSLLTDSSAYFLVVNVGANKRLAYTNNILAGAGDPLPSFTYKLSRRFSTSLYKGYSLNLGQLIYSSSYEEGEGWAGPSITKAVPFTENVSNLFIHPSTTNVQFDARVVGYSLNSRPVTVRLNGQQVDSVYVSAFGSEKISKSLPVSLFSGDSSTILVNNYGIATDAVLLPYYDLTYQRSFNFGGARSFRFELPASNSSRYIEITGFDYGSTSPILYDIENGIYMIAEVSAGVVKINLPPSSKDCKLVLLNAESSSITQINNLQSRNFVNYGLAANQGDYVIITHPLLYSGVNNVQKYKEYRASADGGSFSPVIIESDQLVDQFAWGVRHHPLSIRHFTDYVLTNFQVQPKFFFFIGKGLTHFEFRRNEFNSNTNNLALVPTFGDPGSDNLLTATRTGAVPRIAVGRLSAITGSEVGYYLDKVKQHEANQRITTQTIAAKAWTKNVAHLTGAIDEPYLSAYIESFMDTYEEQIKDSLFGAKVYRFKKNLGLNTAIGTNKTIDTLFQEGLSFITYFGHSSANNLEFNLDDPNAYNNTGKYPVILVNGCTSGNLFNYETIRAVSGGTLSEKYIFSQQKGSVGFIATTHFGLLSPLHTFSSTFYRNISTNMYGQSLAKVMQATMESMINEFPNDYTIRIHAEEITLHGDPALKLNSHAKADYITTDSLVTINPFYVSLADERYTINVKMLNIGKAVKDSITIRIQHESPGTPLKTISTRVIKAPYYDAEINHVVKINPLKDIGLNKLIITLDVNNKVDELSEGNNVITKQFTIHDADIRAVYPYNYSIINNPNVKLFGSTANPLFACRDYVMQMDTTALFNSPSRITRTVTDSGGVITFDPGITLTDSTVYYWRVGLAPASPSTHWSTNSFRYISGSTQGFNQSHFFQNKNAQFVGISQDSLTRNFVFNNVNNKLMIRTGLHPYYAYDQMNINVNDNLVDLYGCKFTSLQFAVFDPLTLAPWENYSVNGAGRFGSWNPCGGRPRKFFEFPYDNQTYRKRAMDFIDSIPAGHYFSVINLGTNANTTFINQWKADTAVFGPGNSIYHKLKSVGFTQIDSFYRNRAMLFIGKKGDPAFPGMNTAGITENEQLVKTVLCPGKEVRGSITTPKFGPVTEWHHFQWSQREIDSVYADNQSFEIIGVQANGTEVPIIVLDTAKSADISWIDANLYPYLKIKSITHDSRFSTPAQLRHLMVSGTMVPEGGISPNIGFEFPTGVVQDSIIVKTWFKNVSSSPFDSLVVHLLLSDEEGDTTVFGPVNSVNYKIAPLAANDSVQLVFRIPSIYGLYNTVNIDVNPANSQPEVFHFNNVLSKGVTGVRKRFFFVGNGNWSNPANWKDGAKPPTILPSGATIIVDPIESGSSVLDVPQTVDSGGKVNVKAGKRLVIQGNLIITQ
jgi:hypothetical protein